MRTRCAEILSFFLLTAMLLQAEQSSASLLRDDLLRIHASLVPKTVFMDYKFRDRLDKGRISIMVLCKESDLYDAGDFVRYVRKLYPNGINDFKVVIQVITYNSFLDAPATKATMFYLLPADGNLVQRVTLKIGSALVFSYSPEALKYGSHISLRIKYRVKPILNLKALKKSGISLRPAILRISEFYPAGQDQ